MEQSDILLLVGVVLALAFIVQMRKRATVFPQLLGLALVVAAVGGYFVYKHREQTQKAQEQTARRVEFESRISGFAAKYNAVRDWQKSLLAKGKPYTAELQSLLARADARPILVFASLLSVSESDGRTVIYFDEAGRPESQFKLQLDCSPDQAHSLVSDGGPYFAVIAQIRSVDNAGDFSLARGRCVDVMPVSLDDYFECVIGPELEKQVHHAGE